MLETNSILRRQVEKERREPKQRTRADIKGQSTFLYLEQTDTIDRSHLATDEGVLRIWALLSQEAHSAREL